jgi:hypothetical protein
MGIPAVVLTILYLLTSAKFVLVAGIFMHLRYDASLLAWIFATGFLLAAAITVAIKAMLEF